MRLRLHLWIVLAGLTTASLACELPKPPITPPKSSYTVAKAKVAVNGDSETTDVARATRASFDIDGLHPLLGRFFSEPDYRAGAVRVAVLSHEYWMNRFRGDPAVIGSNVLVNDERAVIVGVAHPRFKADVAVSVWVPARTGE